MTTFLIDSNKVILLGYDRVCWGILSFTLGYVLVFLLKYCLVSSGMFNFVTGYKDTLLLKDMFFYDRVC